MRARNYRTIKGQPYTRKKFMRGFPPPKITKFTMGDTKSDFEYEVRAVSLKKAQVRHNALEAARIASNRYLGDKLVDAYFFRVLPYPHNVLRENKMIFGAHADRLQDGMKRSFGKPIGTAARVKANQVTMIARVNGDGVEFAKEALKRGSAKLPMPCRIEVESIVSQGVGSGD